MKRGASNPSAASASIRLYTLTGAGAIVLMVLGIGGWAATANLSGAVVGAGTVVVDGNVKRIQHREGGIVGDIKVRNGTVVKAGDLLVRLDDTVTRAGLAMVRKQIDQLSARRMRLSAEGESATAVTAPTIPLGQKAEADSVEYIKAEVALLPPENRRLMARRLSSDSVSTRYIRKTKGSLFARTPRKRSCRGLDRNSSASETLPISN